MSQPKTLSFSKFVLEIEDPANAGEYIAPCAFTQKGFEVTANISTQVIPDCPADPDDEPGPAWEDAEVTSLSVRVSASGILALQHLGLYRGLMLGAKPFNARVTIKETLANGGGYYSGKLLLSSFNQTAQYGQKAEAAVAGQNAGAWIWTNAAA